MSEFEEIKNGVIFEMGEPNPYGKTFTGQSYLKMLCADPECPVGNVTFSPGCRTYWHYHAGGQKLLVTGGRGYYQEEGKPARALSPGDVVEIPANVKHWHGAAEDCWFCHISIEVQPQKGPATWLEPVSDEQYAEANQVKHS